jgi:hypothetical protein
VYLAMYCRDSPCSSDAEAWVQLVVDVDRCTAQTVPWCSMAPKSVWCPWNLLRTASFHDGCRGMLPTCIVSHGWSFSWSAGDTHITPVPLCQSVGVTGIGRQFGMSGGACGGCLMWLQLISDGSTSSRMPHGVSPECIVGGGGYCWGLVVPVYCRGQLPLPRGGWPVWIQVICVTSMG